MASIRVNDDWKIDIDEAGNHIPQRKKVNKKTGEEYYVGNGFFSSVEGALKEIVNIGAREKVLSAEDEVTLAGYIGILREERKALEAALRA
jgi:hypothetical protein